MKVYLIRHGKSEDAKNNLCQRGDSPVIRELVDSDLYKDLEVDKVYASPYARARQTAEILFDEVEILDFIYEFKPPTFLLGKPVEFENDFWKKNWDLIKSDPDWKHEDGESFNDIMYRVKKLVDLLESEFEKVAIVGHGTFFRHLLGYLDMGDKFNIENYIEIYYPMKWDNLQCVEVEV